MGLGYRIKNQQGLHFVTFTVREWLDVFTRREYNLCVIDSIRFCQEKKGLLVYAWVIMTNHLHLILACAGNNRLSDNIRDFKKYTSRKIVKLIENSPKESRKEWLLEKLKPVQADGKRIIRFWKEKNHPEEIFTQRFLRQKMNYIHHNPVKAGYVEKPEHWLWSSAGHFRSGKGLIRIAGTDEAD